MMTHMGEFEIPEGYVIDEQPELIDDADCVGTKVVSSILL
jgi:hypothetical protein